MGILKNFYAKKRSTFKNFYAKRLKKVLCEQLNNKFSRNQGGLNPSLQNSGGVATPPTPSLFGAPVLDNPATITITWCIAGIIAVGFLLLKAQKVGLVSFNLIY